MKTPFTLLNAWFCVCLFLLGAKANAQNCSNLSIAYTSEESRCKSTGSIAINVSGGSGSYNYKVTGPVTTPFTSSSTITGLEAGTYSIIVRDMTNSCQDTLSSAIVAGSYSDPRFQLTKTDVSCAGNDGTIQVSNLQYGRPPFTYKIIAPSPSNVGVTSATGSFSNLTPGEYAIELRDSCSGIQVRRVTIETYSWWIDAVSVLKYDCNNADALITLKDNKGNLNTSSILFGGFTYGLVNAPGDTSWKSGKSFRFYTGTARSATLVAKDACGNVASYLWSIPTTSMPSVASSVATSNFSCTRFTATITNPENLVSPQYCLYDAANNQLACNTTREFNSLAYGSYCIKIRDNCYDTTITRCVTQTKPISSVDPGVNISNYSCTGITATITGQSNLINPEYCLYNASDVQLACNTTGQFTNVAYGSYTIKIKNGCLDTTILRSFTVAKPIGIITNVSVSGGNCSGFTATATGSNLNSPEYCLFDAAGNRITCNNTGIFTNLPYGDYCIKGVSCGADTTAPYCFSGSAPKPSVNASIQINNKICESFTATVTGQTNLTNPIFYLINASNDTITQNSNGIFNNLSYGSYCIHTDDGCYDTTIIKCFTVSRTLPSISSTMTISNKTCSTFTAKITGSNLTRPQYFIYNAANTLVATNTTGVFNNLPYGSYCGEIVDSCAITTLRVCQTVSMSTTVTVTAHKSCSFDSTTLQLVFSSPGSPYSIKIFGPAGNLVHYSISNTANPVVTGLPSLPSGLKYTVIGEDNCGNKDTALVTPDATHITKSATVASKCPSSNWQNGSGNIQISCTSNLFIVTPEIIKKDGVSNSISYSSNTGYNYVFSDLGPGTYIVQYNMQNCTEKMYDTVTVNAYTFPVQNKSAIYQCNDNSFSVGASVNGGVGPYEYEIIGSMPETPSIVSTKQTSSVFTINNGTTYSLVRMRSVDACGNAALNDVSVLPLQNIAITANTTCLFNAVVLSVDTVANATYKWYKKRTATDSTLIGTDLTQSFPFLMPEETGTYVCEMSVNNNCLTRLSYFELTGDCGHQLLPTSISLKGKTEKDQNLLSWTVKDQQGSKFVIERKTSSGVFQEIGIMYASGNLSYQFTDRQPVKSSNTYRIKAITQAGFRYSNLIELTNGTALINVYPNPVQTGFAITFTGTESNSYKLSLINSVGQVIFKDDLNTRLTSSYNFNRTPSMKKGVYVLQLVCTADNAIAHYKLLFE